MERTPFQVFTDKLNALMLEGKAEGISSAVVVIYNDVLDDSETSKCIVVGAGPVFALGMFEFGCDYARGVFRHTSEVE